MKKIRLIEQMEKSECGLACIAMIFKHHDYHMSLQELREKFTAPQSGLTFSQIIQICNYHKFEATAYKISKQNINLIKTGDLPLPLLIQWDRGTHYVVLENISTDFADILDPEKGSFRLDREQFQKLFTGNLIHIDNKQHLETNKFSHIKSLKKDGIYKIFSEVFQNNYSIILMLFILSLFLQFISVMPALIIGRMVDELSVYSELSNFRTYLYYLMVLMTFGFLSTYFKGKFTIILNNKIDYSLMTNYIDHLLRLPIMFFKKRSHGDLLYRANLLTSLREIISTHFIGGVLNFLLVLIYAIFMINISFSLGVGVIFYSLMILSILYVFTGKLFILSKRVLLNETDFQENISETISSIHDIKMYNLVKSKNEKFNKLIKRYLMNVMKNENLINIVDSLVSSLRLLQGVTLFLIGGVYVKNGIVSLGELVTFIFFADAFMAPIFSLSQSYFSLVQLSTISQRVNDVLNSETEEIANAKKEVFTDSLKLKGKIEFKNVYFKFSVFEPYILENVSFVIEPGEKTWLKGNSGSGKSTILKLILGILTVTKGEILIDDIPISKYELEKIRKEIALVSQENNLFSSNVQENILVGNELQSTRYYDTLVSTNLSDFLETLISTDETTVLENGENFSMGQRQRILLARALYKKSSILLMDEPLVSLDANSKKIILESLMSRCSTLLLTSHEDIDMKDIHKIIEINGTQISVHETKDNERTSMNFSNHSLSNPEFMQK
ncbi:peptidase domain-containing ABC transporter [Exiguobacterium mexicanum]